MPVIETSAVQPSTAPFRYTRAQKNTIRLFRFLRRRRAEVLQLEMVSDVSFEHSVDNHIPEYFALSYCWGDQSLTETIVLNGCSFAITSSLYSALKTIQDHHISAEAIGEFRLSQRRPREQFWLWSDAICINQQDIEEKNEQVQHMWRVYSYAARVLAWLGDESEHTSAAYNATKKYAESCPGDNRVYQLCPLRSHPVLEPTEEAGLLDLTSRPYFNRTWTITEYTQKLHDQMVAVILCGRYVFRPYVAYHLTATKTFRSREDHTPFAKLHEDLVDDGVYRNASLMFDLVLNSGCTNPRDRIFAMAAHPEVRFLAKRGGNELKVDYHIRLHELVFISLEWYGRLMEDSWFGGYQPTVGGRVARMNDASSMFIRVCKGLNSWQDDDTVETWFGRHQDLDISQLPQSMVLASGQRIICGDLLNS